jgi:hypothetical protein
MTTVVASRLSRVTCYNGPLASVMSIPNVKRFRIVSPDGSDSATIMAVLPKGANVDAYLKDAASRFDWKALEAARGARARLHWADDPTKEGDR